jgi:hypothetical protein
MKTKHREYPEFVEAYVAIGVPLDRLPYTAEFDRLLMVVNYLVGRPATHLEVWTELISLRKRGRLPRVRRDQQRSPDFWG